jgi:hypothetical protein
MTERDHRKAQTFGRHKQGREWDQEDKNEHVQLEKRIGNLKHENVGVAMVMHDKDALARAAHAPVLVVILQPLQARRDGRVFFGLGFFGAGEYVCVSELL